MLVHIYRTKVRLCLWKNKLDGRLCRRLKDNLDPKCSLELWSKVLWTWVEGHLYDSFDVLKIIAVISPVNN